MMRKTFFNSVKSAFNIPCALESNSPYKQNIFKAVSALPEDIQAKLKERLGPNINELLINEVKNSIKAGKGYIAVGENLDPMAALKAFKSAVEVADILLINDQLRKLLQEQDKVFLAEAYASLADATYRFEPSNIELVKSLLDKAKELDNRNQKLQEIFFSMNFFDLCPKPPQA